jgi:hypothetical protein
MPSWIYYVGLSAAAVALLAWLLYVTRSGGDYDRKVRTRLHRAYRRLVFWLGDIRRIGHFPWITWDVHQHGVEYDEALSALPHVRPGDVGLHLDRGYLSNMAIPGFTKHAWIHVDGPARFTGADGVERTDVTGMQIVEAVSEGVVRRSALYPIRSDYTLILRPRDASREEIDHAVEKAKRIVGCQYDADFKFDIEEELEHFGAPGENRSEVDEDLRELDVVSTNLGAEWDGGFSCTETVSFAWWHKRRALRLFRKPARGKMVILADDMINNGFEIVWLSESVTPEFARKRGLGEEGVEMIREFRQRQCEARARAAATAKPKRTSSRILSNRGDRRAPQDASLN